MSLAAEANVVSMTELVGRLQAALLLQRAAYARDPAPGYRQRMADLDAAPVRHR